MGSGPTTLLKVRRCSRDSTCSLLQAPDETAQFSASALSRWRRPRGSAGFPSPGSATGATPCKRLTEASQPFPPRYPSLCVCIQHAPVLRPPRSWLFHQRRAPACCVLSAPPWRSWALKLLSQHCPQASSRSKGPSETLQALPWQCMTSGLSLHLSPVG